MTSGPDLAVIVPDQDIETTIRTLLTHRQQSLGIAPIEFEVFRHDQRDAGVRVRGAEFSRGLRSRFRHCLLIFDHEGSGAERISRDTLEAEIKDQLRRVGWDDQAEAIVISPELETWLWGRTHHLGQAVDWNEGDLRTWLQNQGHDIGQGGKPVRPRKALEAVLRRENVPRSAAIYGEVASNCSLMHCSDSSFNRLRQCLQTWFPISGQG